MSKFRKISKFILGGFILLLYFTSCESKKRVDWSPSFDSRYKMPFGTYICKEEMSDLFPNSKIDVVSYRLDDYLEENNYYNHILTFMITDPNIDSLESLAIRDFVKMGNIYFQSYQESDMFEDSIQTSSVITMPYFQYLHRSLKSLADKTQNYTLRLKDKQYEDHPYILNRFLLHNYFSVLPPSAEVLGTIEINGNTQPNFIKVPYFGGWYYLHAEPFVFTNISLLNTKSADYVKDVLSFLPNKDIVWNNSRIFERETQSKSEGGMFAMLSFAWQHKPLKYGLLVLFCSLALFLLLNSSRRQNPVAFHKPYSNDLLDYSESLVHAYENSLNFKYLCSQKITYFLNMIKEHYYFSHVQFNDQFANQLHLKSKVPLNDCINLVNYINQINQKGFCTSEQFRHLASLVDGFYLKSKLYGK